MASVFIGQEFHEGERELHRLLKVPEYDNPTTYGLTSQAAYMLQAAPLLALGTLDEEKRPWTTLLGDEPGFARPMGGPIVGVRADVDAKYDPVIEALIPTARREEQAVRYPDGKMVAGLTIDLMTRKRVKIAGKFLAGAVGVPDDDGAEDEEKSRGIGQLQMGVKVEQSLGNCPKYLNKKQIRPAPAQPQLISDSPKLPIEAIKLINKADTIFISSSHADEDMDTNIRGGPAGFVRVMSNNADGAEIIYPEYSGNRLYQTLGNLRTTPLAGIVIPNFETGDVLYATGRTEILIGHDAAAILPRSNLAVKIKVTAARFVKEGLPYRGIPDEMSPYNPNVRLLSTEGNIASQLDQSTSTAKLVHKEHITPTISRYRFSLTNPSPYKPGQWVALDFSEELDMGYSHMRDDDPTSLNDDFVRTFTVSNPPMKEASKQSEFELIVRLHGPVTSYLKKINQSRSLEIPLRGFGGDFVIGADSNGVTPFIAGGVGITPLLGQLDSIDLTKLQLFWVIKFEDVEFVLDIFKRYPELAKHAIVFFTGTSASMLKSSGAASLDQIKDMGAATELRRPAKEDFDAVDASKWYLCAGNPLRRHLLEWLEGKTVVYENFDY